MLQHQRYLSTRPNKLDFSNKNYMTGRELIIISSEAETVSLDGSEPQEASEYESEPEEIENSENEEENQSEIQVVPKRLKLEVQPTAKRLGMDKGLSAYIPTKSIISSRPLKPFSKSSSTGTFTLKPFKLPKVTKTASLSGGLRPGTTLGLRRSVAVMIHSLFDPNGDKAFIVYTPKIQLSEQEKRMQLSKFPGKPVQFEVEVVVVRDLNLPRIQFWLEFFGLINWREFSFCMTALLDVRQKMLLVV